VPRLKDTEGKGGLWKRGSLTLLKKGGAKCRIAEDSKHVLGMTQRGREIGDCVRKGRRREEKVVSYEGRLRAEKKGQKHIITPKLWADRNGWGGGLVEHKLILNGRRTDSKRGKEGQLTKWEVICEAAAGQKRPLGMQYHLTE